jgi:bacterioferritin-associated ferredoxin
MIEATDEATDGSDKLICLCYKLTEKDIVDAIRGGADTMQKLAEKTRLAERCEGCVMDGLELLAMHVDGFDWDSKEQLHVTGDLPYHNKWANLASRILPRPLFNRIIGSLDVGHFMSTIWLAGPDVTTRAFVSNHTSPYFPRQGGRRRIRITIYDAEGALLRQRETFIEEGATEMIDVAKELGASADALAYGGMTVKILPTKEVPYVFFGSLRFYTQWRNETCVTQVHEQFARNEFGSFDRDHHGYATFPEVLVGDWVTTMAVFNNRADEHRAEWVLQRNDGGRVSRPLSLPGRAALVTTPQELFGDEAVADAVAVGPACVYLSSSKALTHYYLNHNVKEGIWQAQHL